MDVVDVVDKKNALTAFFIKSITYLSILLRVQALRKAKTFHLAKEMLCTFGLDLAFRIFPDYKNS